MLLLRWAVILLILAGVAALLGFTGVAADLAGAAQVLFIVFGALFVVLFVTGLLHLYRSAGRPADGR